MKRVNAITIDGVRYDYDPDPRHYCRTCALEGEDFHHSGHGHCACACMVFAKDKKYLGRFVRHEKGKQKRQRQRRQEQ